METEEIELQEILQDLLFKRLVYSGNSDEEKAKEILELEKKARDLHTKIIQSKFKYLVEYEAEIYINGIKHLQIYQEYLFFKEDCTIDTFRDGWIPYKDNSTVISLIIEVFSFLQHSRFTLPTVKNIKRF